MPSEGGFSDEGAEPPGRAPVHTTNTKYPMSMAKIDYTLKYVFGAKRKQL